jgi:ribosomal protein S20
MSENVVNSVVKPAIIDGNPVPMLRYMIVAPMSGAAIYSMYYAVLGEDTRNKFKSKAEQFWMQFIRAEGLAILSNSFDEMGGVIDSYKPAVLRTVTSLTSETMATIQGKKKVTQSLEDLAKENIVFLNHATRAVSRVYKPLEKRVNNSKRRQRQFTDAYFRTNPVIGDEMDFLTERSPYYRTVNESFWSDDPDAKARAYYSALNFVIHHEMKKDPSLVKVPFKAKKLAKSILKSLISRSRPIPSSWRERTTGKKTRYQIYYSKLNPKFQQEELELDKLYKQKVREFNSAINRYRNLYGMDAVLAPTNK